MRHNVFQRLLLSAMSLTFFMFLAEANDCSNLGLSQCPTPYDKHTPDPSNMLAWPQSERVIGLRNTYKMYDGDVFKPGKTVHPLPKAEYELPIIQYIAQGSVKTIQDYLKNQSVTGLLI